MMANLQMEKDCCQTSSIHVLLLYIRIISVTTSNLVSFVSWIISLFHIIFLYILTVSARFFSLYHWSHGQNQAVWLRFTVKPKQKNAGVYTLAACEQPEALF